MSDPLRVNLLLEDTTLFGGVKIALHHANLLHRRGHDVRVVSRGPRPDWFEVEAPFLEVASFEPERVPAADVNLATFWTTIAAAADLPGQAAHFCQGYEGSYTHNVDEHSAIDQAYATPIPGLALAPHLAAILEQRFRRPVRLLPPAVDPALRPRRRRAPRRPPRVLVVHPFENDWKGVPTALEAVIQLRASGHGVRLVRLSQWPLGEAERTLLPPDEYHCHLTPAQVARLQADCDLLLAPSWEQEGFGLPVLEAMASGLPVVASEVSAFSWYASGAAELVPAHDAGGFARAAAAVLGDPRRWRRMRRAGLEVARAFSEEVAAAAAEGALRWLASGAWRDER